MLIEINDKVVSTQIFEKNFVCDLQACKGACCIAGDSGAPLTLDEISILEDDIDAIKPHMRSCGVQVVENQGVFYVDQENEEVTSLVNNKECAFVYFDDKGVSKCSIEKAHANGATKLKKPISCHLYPIRVKTFKKLTAVNYHSWDICSPACICGDKLKVPVFRFLKEGLIRAFGELFFNELVVVEEELKSREAQKKKN